MAALARQLARRHEVTVLTSRGPGLPAESIEHDIRVVRVPVFFRRQLPVANFASMLAYLPSGLVRGASLAKHGQFDVVNTHFVVPTGPVGHAISRFYGLPNVLSVHGGDLYDPSKRFSPHRHAVLRAAVRFLLGNADVLVGQSRDTLQRVRDIYNVNRPTELIPLGIERPASLAAGPGLRKDFGLPQDAFVMTTVGRLVARKNTALLVQSLATERLRNAHLAIVGDGPEAPQLRRLAAELGVAGRLHMLGALMEHEKYRALAMSDVFVSASRHEGFGIVFLEAMACGLPVVCFDRGGQTDFLTDGKTGRVVALDDKRTFAAAIAGLRDDPASRAAMGRYNRELVEKFFIDTCATRYEEIFAQAVEPGFRARDVFAGTHPPRGDLRSVGTIPADVRHSGNR